MLELGGAVMLDVHVLHGTTYVRFPTADHNPPLNWSSRDVRDTNGGLALNLVLEPLA